MSKSKFTTENIMALLKAASEGQTFMDVIRISDVQITYHALAGWLGRGRRESKIDLNTPHAKFAANGIRGAKPLIPETVRNRTWRQSTRRWKC